MRSDVGSPCSVCNVWMVGQNPEVVERYVLQLEQVPSILLYIVTTRAAAVSLSRSHCVSRDTAARREFSHWILQQSAEDPTFI
jgi:hypothetical protein